MNKRIRSTLVLFAFALLGPITTGAQQVVVAEDIPSPSSENTRSHPPSPFS